MWLKILTWLDIFTEKASNIFHYIGSVILAVMMFFTFADVAGRYFLKQPIKGSFEVTEYMLAILISFSIAYCGVKKGHIHVDVLTMRLPQRVQDILNSITQPLGFILIFLTTWHTVRFALSLHASGMSSTVLVIPKYPFVFIAAVGLGLYSLVLLKDFMESLYKAVKR
ncbi:MAG: TRAP transporter small permease [Firmicutes bacterium]|nr:TRAP transporter small permease [Bacillota bacterium]